MIAVAQQAIGDAAATGANAVLAFAISMLDPHQVVPTNPRRTGEEHDAFFELFNLVRRPYRVQGTQMSPRYAPDVLVWAMPLDRSLEVDMEIIVELRTGERLLGQVNAASDDVVEIVNCWRANRVGIPRSEIDAVLLVMGECGDLDDDDRVAHSPGRPLSARCRRRYPAGSGIGNESCPSSPRTAVASAGRQESNNEVAGDLHDASRR